MTNRLAEGDGINSLALQKDGGELYIFLYRDSRLVECLRHLGRLASREDLSFSWYDAAVVSGKMRAALSQDTSDGDDHAD